MQGSRLRGPRRGACALARPPPWPASPSAQYVLVVCTPTHVHLFALTMGGPRGAGLHVHETGIAFGTGEGGEGARLRGDRGSESWVAPTSSLWRLR